MGGYATDQVYNDTCSTRTRTRTRLLLNPPSPSQLPPPYFFTCSANLGTASNKSATKPTSATWKIGASGSLLMATIILDSFIPAKCWIAPEMPMATYSSGATTWVISMAVADVEVMSNRVEVDEKEQAIGMERSSRKTR